MRTLAVVLALLVVVPVAAADTPSHRATGDLAVRARHILTTYCGKCHGEKDASGRLNVFDHKATSAHDQPAPFAAKSRALIVEFLKDGSMPLGNHSRPTDAEIAVLEKWVAADAPAYPKQFDETTTTAAVLADWNATLDKAAQPYTRYVTLAYLLKPDKIETLDDALMKLKVAEEELSAAVTPVGMVKALVPVDAAATTFRFDLRDTGWHHTGLFKPTADMNDVYPMIPFDLIWLENPYTVDISSQAAEARDAVVGMNPHHPAPNPFRPQLFLQGGWLTRQLSAAGKPTPLAEELAALAALGKVKDDEAKRKLLKGPKPQPFVVTNTAPPAPTTSWYVRKTATRGDAPTLSVAATLDAKPIPDKLPGDADIEIAVTLNRAGAVQLTYVAPTEFPRGWTVATEALTRGSEPPANVRTVIAANPNGKFALTAVGTQHYVAYAAATAFKPVVVRSAHQSGNYPIFRVFPPDATVPVARQVIPITVVEAKQ